MAKTVFFNVKNSITMLWQHSRSAFLLNFIQEHNYSLTLHIDFPLFNNNSTRMVLANHTLRQLNIIGDGQHSGVLSSVSSFLNKCITPMGRRIFNYNINNPSFDKEATTEAI